MPHNYDNMTTEELIEDLVDIDFDLSDSKKMITERNLSEVASRALYEAMIHVQVAIAELKKEPK